MSNTLEDTELNNRVFSTIGQASMCWSKTPTGIYDDTRAVELGRELMNLITLHTQRAYRRGVNDVGNKLINGEFDKTYSANDIEHAIAQLTNPTEGGERRL